MHVCPILTRCPDLLWQLPRANYRAKDALHSQYRTALRGCEFCMVQLMQPGGLIYAAMVHLLHYFQSRRGVMHQRPTYSCLRIFKSTTWDFIATIGISCNFDIGRFYNSGIWQTRLSIAWSGRRREMSSLQVIVGFYLQLQSTSIPSNTVYDNCARYAQNVANSISGRQFIRNQVSAQQRRVRHCSKSPVSTVVSPFAQQRASMSWKSMDKELCLPLYPSQKRTILLGNLQKLKWTHQPLPLLSSLICIPIAWLRRFPV